MPHASRGNSSTILEYCTSSGETASGISGDFNLFAKKVRRRDIAFTLAMIQKTDVRTSQLNPRRCVESQYIALQTRFELWCEAEPVELEDMPTEAESEAHEKALTEHYAVMQDLVGLAQRLICVFGVGPIRDKALLDAFDQLLVSCLKYVFPDRVDVPVGARLPFLRPMAKYLGRLKGNASLMKKIERSFNEKETKLRATAEYADLLAYDLECIVEFRKAGGFKAFPETKLPAATSSLASEESVSSGSLSPVPEGDEDTEDESPSPRKTNAPPDDESSSEESASGGIGAAAATTTTADDLESEGEGSQSTASRKRSVASSSSSSSSPTKRLKADTSEGSSEASKSQRTLRDAKYTPVASPLSSTPSSMPTGSVFDNVGGKRRHGSFGRKRKSGAGEESGLFLSRKTDKFSGLSESTIQHADSETEED